MFHVSGSRLRFVVRQTRTGVAIIQPPGTGPAAQCSAPVFELEGQVDSPSRRSGPPATISASPSCS